MDESGRSELDQAFARFVAGRDPDDLALVFDRAAARLLLVGMHLLGDAAAAEDLLQATFLDAIRGADGFDTSRPVMPWLLAVLTRRAGKIRRSRSRVLQDRVEGDLDALPGKDREPSAQVAEREVIVQIAAAVESLSKPYREVLLMRLVHDLQPVEIAHALDREVGTVHVQLHRGLERLRRILPKSLAGVLALYAGAERGLAAVRQRVLEEVGRQVLPVVATVVGGLWMKKVLAAAAAVLVLLASGTWVLVGMDGEANGSQPLPPELFAVELGAPSTISTSDEQPAIPKGKRRPVATPSSKITFTGRIVAAESGAPIAGAEVHMSAYASSPADSDAAAGWENSPDVTSDTDGRFEIAIDHHAGMGIEFSVEVPGRVETLGGNYYFRSGLSRDLGDIEVYMGSEVRVRVVDGRGEPVEGYNLYFERLPGDRSKERQGLLGLMPLQGLEGGRMATTDSEGRLPAGLLYPGRWRVRGGSFSPSMGILFVGPDEILVRPGDAPREISVAVREANPSKTVSGRIVDVRGAPMPFFKLEVRHLGMSSSYYSYRSRRDGYFSFLELNADSGPVTIKPSDSSFEMVDLSDPIDIGTQDLELVVRRIETVPLTVEIVDEAGAPVDAFDYRFMLIKKVSFEQLGLYTMKMSFKDGKEDLAWHGHHSGGRLELDEIVPGSYLLYVRGQDPRFAPLQSMSIEVRPGEAQTLRMVLEDMHTWRVRVIGEDGDPVPGSRVELLQPFGENEIRINNVPTDVEPFYTSGWVNQSFRTDEAVSDERGIAELHSAHALERAALRLTDASHQPMLLPLTVSPPADEPLEIIIEGAGMVKGVIDPLDVILSWGPTEQEIKESEFMTTRVKDLVSGMPMIVAAPSGVVPDRENSVKASVDEQGRFRLESLAPGDWELFFRGGIRTEGASLRYRVGTVRELKPGEIRKVELSVAELEPAQVSGLVFIDGELSVAAKLLFKGPVNSWVYIDSEGHFTSKLLPPGRYAVTLFLEGAQAGKWRPHADAPIEVAPGESVDRVLHFKRHRLTVRILEAGGSPIEPRWVTLENRERGEPENYHQLHQEKGDADGRVVFDPVPNRDLYVLVWDEGTRPTRGAGPVVQSKPFTLLGPIRLQPDSSSTEVELRMPPRK